MKYNAIEWLQARVSRLILALILGVYLGVGVLTFFVFYKALRSLSKDLGVEYARQIVLKEKADISNGLDREIVLARKLADSPLLKAWAKNEKDLRLKEQALAELESYKKYFSDQVYFFVVHRSGNYYFNDGSNSYSGKELQYTLNPTTPEDSWYFATLEKVQDYSLNVNYDKAIQDTKVWINVVMREGNQVLGMAGTGLSFGSFLDKFVQAKQKGVLPILMDQEGAIQAHPDPKLVDLSSISKEEGQKSLIFRLLPLQEDKNKLQIAMDELKKKEEQGVRVLSLKDKEGDTICALAYIPPIQWYTLIFFNDRQVLEFSRFLPLLLVSIVSLLILGALVLLSLQIGVLRPLSELTNFAKEYQLGHPRALKLSTRKDELGILSNTLKNMLDTIQEHTHTLEEKVSDRTKAVRDLLDHMEEGILSFGPDLRVKTEYSKECERLFGKPIGGTYLPELIDPEGKEQSRLFQRTLAAAFNTQDAYKKEILLSLLPKEISLQGKIVTQAIRLLDSDRMMMILKDVTYNKRLEEQISQEQKILKFVIHALSNRLYFLDTLESFEKFLHNLNYLGLDEQYRMVHTYKGVFLQMDLVYTPQALHALEDSLSSYKVNPKKQLTLPSLDTKPLEEAFKKDQKVLEQYLGARFFETKQVYTLETEDLHKLEGLAEKIQQASSIVQTLNINEELAVIPRLRTVRIFELLSVFPHQISELGKLRGKELLPLAISGENVRIKPERYENLLLQFVHIFRNAIIHGIENPEERVKKGKPAEGKIQITVHRIKDGLEIKIRDDGRGIDWEAIRNLAIRKKLVESKQSYSLSKEELKSLLLTGQVSTREGVDLFSGRGIGLCAVHEEVLRLGGRMDIHSELEIGTEICLQIPDSEVYV
ncbi:MAG: ATP-binding protein [Spirochaetales bacterium]